MQFIDEAEIHVKAGDGGAGAVAFRREKFIPRGGPSGGDGGNGSDIILETDERLTTLLDFRFKREYVARNGEPGRGRDQNGHGAAELLLKVPPGTLVRAIESGEVLADLRDNGTRLVLAKGGRGGLGNMNFATPTLQAPRFSQPGTEGEERRVRLELRLLADVGLVGFPNAGKSTLVARVSRARPKIADYPFTTLQPHLGVVQYKDGRSFVLTDLPGLIEGAHLGAGLGTRFLKHMQRCRVVIHLLDASSAPLLGRDLIADFDAINRELALFDPALGRKAQVIAANKIDLPDGRAAAEEFKQVLEKRGLQVLLVSGATGEGIEALMDATVHALDRAGPAAPLERDLPGAKVAAGSDSDADSDTDIDADTDIDTDTAVVAVPGAVAEPKRPPPTGRAAALQLADVDPEAQKALDDEREEAVREKQKRAPPLTGRRKDGMTKEKAHRSEQPLAGKFRPTSEAAATLLSAAARRGGGGKAVVPAVRTLGPKKAKLLGPKPKAAAAVGAKAAAKPGTKAGVAAKTKASRAQTTRGQAEKARAQAEAAVAKTRPAAAEPKAKKKKKLKKVLPPSKKHSAKARRKPTR